MRKFVFIIIFSILGAKIFSGNIFSQSNSNSFGELSSS